jgi:3-phenylpropionate/trans-cinnamate dioxygenase ferredoxin reductase subunit
VADRRTFVIVGAGLTGAKAAETLREEGFDGRIVLVGAEDELPYERPPLSKGYLQGKEPREGAHVHDAGFYAEQDIELLRGVEATALDPAAKTVTLSTGEDLRYDRLLIATGAQPRRPPIPGAHLEGVRVLRTLADADALREHVNEGTRFAVIGAGWIGCEAAASARGRGADVTLLEAASQPLERVLGAQIGAFYADVHRSHGVDLRTNVGVERIAGRTRAERVELAGGAVVECDLVLLGVGVAPDTRLAASAGLAFGDGIVVDAHLRTSAPDVYAAGDVAAAEHPRYNRLVRVEHWANALNQGIAAGRSMLDRGEPYDRLPYFFSDQYDVGMEYAGHHDASDQVVLQGDPADGRFRAFWVDGEGRATAGMHVNDWDAIEPIKELVAARATQLAPEPS